MPARALDLSKYTNSGNPVSDDVVTKWCNKGVDLCLIQAHPAGYGQEQSLQEIQVVSRHRCDRHDSGMPWDAYIYDYLAYDDWMQGALVTLDLAAAQGFVPRKGWADEEDVMASVRAWPVVQRADAIRRHLTMFDSWLTAHQRPRCGVYTGRWWWAGDMENWVEWRDRELWDSNYDGEPDAAIDFVPYGGWTSCRIKQYWGTSTDVVVGLDLDVLSDEELAELQQKVIQEMAIKLGQGLNDRMAANNDQPLFGHAFRDEVDDDGATYKVEECYGTLGRYVASNVSGDWLCGGPF